MVRAHVTSTCPRASLRSGDGRRRRTRQKSRRTCGREEALDVVDAPRAKSVTILNYPASGEISSRRAVKKIHMERNDACGRHVNISPEIVRRVCGLRSSYHIPKKSATLLPFWMSTWTSWRTGLAYMAMRARTLAGAEHTLGTPLKAHPVPHRGPPASICVACGGGQGQQKVGQSRHSRWKLKGLREALRRHRLPFTCQLAGEGGRQTWSKSPRCFGSHASFFTRRARLSVSEVTSCKAKALQKAPQP